MWTNFNVELSIFLFLKHNFKNKTGSILYFNKSYCIGQQIPCEDQDQKQNL